jgi:hypothetical protein
VRSPFGAWPAVLFAKSLRRSGEVALAVGCTAFAVVIPIVASIVAVDTMCV